MSILKVQTQSEPTHANRTENKKAS